MPRHKRRSIAFHTLSFPLCSLFLLAMWNMSRTGRNQASIRVCAGVGNLSALLEHWNHPWEAALSNVTGPVPLGGRAGGSTLCSAEGLNKLLWPAQVSTVPNLWENAPPRQAGWANSFFPCLYTGGMLRGRLKEKVNMQPAMSCSCLCVPALHGWSCTGPVRKGDLASLGVSGAQAGLAAVASLGLPLCSLCSPEEQSDDIIKSLILSRAKCPAQPQVTLSCSLQPHPWYEPEALQLSQP